MQAARASDSYADREQFMKSKFFKLALKAGSLIFFLLLLCPKISLFASGTLTSTVTWNSSNWFTGSYGAKIISTTSVLSLNPAESTAADWNAGTLLNIDTATYANSIAILPQSTQFVQNSAVKWNAGSLVNIDTSTFLNSIAIFRPFFSAVCSKFRSSMECRELGYY